MVVVYISFFLGRSEVKCIVLEWQAVGLDNATLIFILLVIKCASLEAVGVLCVEQLGT